MKLQEILTEYGNKKGLGSLPLDQKGILRLLVNETNLVSFEEALHRPGFYIYASVGAIPPQKGKELGLNALEGNLFGKETGRAALGYFPQTRALILFQYFPEASIDYPLFERKFDEYLQFLTHWKNKVATTEAPSIEELSLNKHIGHLPDQGKMKIFFA